jgi:hypothetical protein
MHADQTIDPLSEQGAGVEFDALADASEHLDMIKIPAGTKQQTCVCGTNFYWVVSPRSGKMIPVTASVERGRAPQPKQWGWGINHFVDCPRGRQFRKQ